MTIPEETEFVVECNTETFKELVKLAYENKYERFSSLDNFLLYAPVTGKTRWLRFVKNKYLCFSDFASTYTGCTIFSVEEARRFLRGEKMNRKRSDWNIQQASCGWYIGGNHSEERLHIDGSISFLTQTDGIFTGLFASKEAAQKILDKHYPKPKLTFDDLKNGDKFYFSDIHTLCTKVLNSNTQQDGYTWHSNNIEYYTPMLGNNKLFVNLEEKK